MTVDDIVKSLSGELKAAEDALAEAQLMGPEMRASGGSDESDFAPHLWDAAVIAHYDFKKQSNELKTTDPNEWNLLVEGGVLDAVAAIASTLHDFLWDHDYFVEWDGKYPNSKPTWHYHDKWEKNELHYMVGSVAQGGEWTDGLENTRKVVSALHSRLKKSLELAAAIREGEIEAGSH